MLQFPYFQLQALLKGFYSLSLFFIFKKSLIVYYFEFTFIFYLDSAIISLKEFLNSKGIDAKVHYPIPMHLQPAARYLQYQRGDFPVCEAVCDSVISLPVHEFIEDHHIDHVVNVIREFYDES